MFLLAQVWLFNWRIEAQMWHRFPATPSPFLAFSPSAAAAATPHSDHEALEVTASDSRKWRKNKPPIPAAVQRPHGRQCLACLSDLFGSAADKTMQMYAAIFRLPDPAEGLFYFCSCEHLSSACAGWSSVLEQRHVMNMTEHQGIHTILQSATARWALRVLSVLSLLCGSRYGGLPIWKIFPADLGRFLRPFDAELMHTHPRTKQPRCKRVLSSYTPQTPPLSSSCLTALRLLVSLLSPRFYAKFPSASYRLGFVLLPCLSPLAFHASTAGEGADLFPRRASERREKYRMSACDSSPHCFDCDGGASHLHSSSSGQ